MGASFQSNVLRKGNVREANALSILQDRGQTHFPITPLLPKSTATPRWCSKYDSLTKRELFQQKIVPARRNYSSCLKMLKDYSRNYLVHRDIGLFRNQTKNCRGDGKKNMKGEGQCKGGYSQHPTFSFFTSKETNSLPEKELKAHKVWASLEGLS